jgi:hypothetical protein
MANEKEKCDEIQERRRDRWSQGVGGGRRFDKFQIGCVQTQVPAAFWAIRFWMDAEIGSAYFKTAVFRSWLRCRCGRMVLWRESSHPFPLF